MRCSYFRPTSLLLGHLHLLHDVVQLPLPIERLMLYLFLLVAPNTAADNQIPIVSGGV